MTIKRDNPVERDERGCFPGCYSHGCEATRCGDFKARWRERKRQEAKDDLLQTLRSLGDDVRELAALLKRRMR